MAFSAVEIGIGHPPAIDLQCRRLAPAAGRRLDITQIHDWREKAAADATPRRPLLSEGSSENKTAAISGGRFHGAKQTGFAHSIIV
jgi:hypothetical protein